MEATQTLTNPIGTFAATTHQVERIAFMDNIRALALLLGVLLHAGLGYASLTAGAWPSADANTSWLFDYWIWIVHTFRMPLFFIIAGFFAHLLVQKRGLGGFFKNRLLRITLPFLIFWPLMVISLLGIIFYAASHLPADNAVLQLFRAAMANANSGGDQQNPPLSTTHLWFLYYLTIFCLMTAVAYRFGRFGQSLSNYLMKPWVALILLPVVTALCLVNKNIPHPAPERLMPELWAMGFYGLSFLAGWAFYTKPDSIMVFKPYWPHMLITSCVAAVMLLVNLSDPVVIPTDPDELAKLWDVTYNAQHFMGVAATAVLAWHLSLLSLLGARHFLNKSHSAMRFISDGSYWTYIIHLPLVFYFQFVLNTVELPIFVKFCIVTLATLVICYLSYAALVRHTPIGWLLNGRKKSAG